MSNSVPQLAEKRAARTRARAEFQRRIGIAKVDLAPAVLKRRAVTEAQRKTMSVAHQAIDIANDSRGIVAATVAALLLWLARKPIMGGANRAFNRFQMRRAASKTLSGRMRLLADGYWQKLKDYADD
jgi:hypothetical protein